MRQGILFIGMGALVGKMGEGLPRQGPLGSEGSEAMRAFQKENEEYPKGKEIMSLHQSDLEVLESSNERCQSKAHQSQSQPQQNQ